jgi:hypothetical protein
LDLVARTPLPSGADRLLSGAATVWSGSILLKNSICVARESGFGKDDLIERPLLNATRAVDHLTPPEVSPENPPQEFFNSIDPKPPYASRESRRSRAAAMRAPPGSPTIRLTGQITPRASEKEPCAVFGEIAACREAAGGGTPEDYHRQTLALAEKLGMRRLVAYFQLGLGELDPRAGKEVEGAPARRLLQHAAGHASGINGSWSR